MTTLVEEKKAAARTARLGLRATLQQQILIQRAAEALNKSVTEFVLDSACTAAENTLLNQRLFLLNDGDWQKFQDALEQPAKVKPGLQKLMKEKAPWE
jgi:uncharacterized protein (DUF1778 family)